MIGMTGISTPSFLRYNYLISHARIENGPIRLMDFKWKGRRVPVVIVYSPTQQKPVKGFEHENWMTWKGKKTIADFIETQFYKNTWNHKNYVNMKTFMSIWFSVQHQSPDGSTTVAKSAKTVIPLDSDLNPTGRRSSSTSPRTKLESTTVDLPPRMT